MSILISNFSIKGGISKSGQVEHIATALALKGKKVLCIDLDPQGNLTSNFGVYNHYNNENIKSMFDVIYNIPLSEAILPVPDSYLSDSRERQMYVELAMQRFEFEDEAVEELLKETYGNDVFIREKRTRTTEDAEKEMLALFPKELEKENSYRRFGRLDIVPMNSGIKILAQLLTSQYVGKEANIQIGLKIQDFYNKFGEDYYDYILIDTAVAQDAIQMNVLYASDYVLMPNDLDFASEEGVRLAKYQIDKIRNDGIDVKILGMILQRVPNDLVKATNLSSYLRLKKLANELDIYMFKNVVSEYKLFKPLRESKCNAFNKRVVESEILESGNRKNQLPNTMYRLSNQIFYRYKLTENSKGNKVKVSEKLFDYSQLGWDYIHLVEELEERIKKEGK